MSEDGLHPYETILRLCAAAAPEPWYPRLFVKQEGVDPKALSHCLEELWISGLIERADGGPEKGPAISLTREGQRVLLDPEALRRLRADEPLSSTDRAAVIRRLLRSQPRPYITRFLLALNILIFIAGYYSAGKVGAGNDFLRGAPITAPLQAVWNKSGVLAPEYLIEGQWWRLLTAGFVHFGFLHLLMNMASLHVAGRFIEQLWGHLRYLVIYLVSVLGGCCLGIAHVPTLLAGASGAICGLLAAEAVWFLFNRRYLPRALLRQARTGFLVNLVLLIFISSFKNVSGWGHFGGAAAGALAAMLLHLHRFGPPLWRWLTIAGFVPMAWYGYHVIEQARATNPSWLELEHSWLELEEKRFFARHARPAFESMNAARRVYAAEVEPLLETHPARRDPEKVEAIWPVLAEQNRKLTAVADGLARAGPYHDPDLEAARELGRQYVLAGIELFDLAEHVLRLGEKRTDKDRQALRKQKERINELYHQWRSLL
jgi:rhomboid protease GluP